MEELSPAGDLVRVLRIRDFPLALTDDEVRTEREAYGDIGKQLPAPATRAAYQAIVVDAAGALWLQQYRGSSEREHPDTWQILSADDVWLGSIVLPGRFLLLGVNADEVLGGVAGRAGCGTPAGAQVGARPVETSRSPPGSSGRDPHHDPSMATQPRKMP